MTIAKAKAKDTTLQRPKLKSAIALHLLNDVLLQHDLHCQALQHPENSRGNNKNIVAMHKINKECKVMVKNVEKDPPSRTLARNYNQTQESAFALHLFPCAVFCSVFFFESFESFEPVRMMSPKHLSCNGQQGCCHAVPSTAPIRTRSLPQRLLLRTLRVRQGDLLSPENEGQSAIRLPRLDA